MSVILNILVIFGISKVEYMEIEEKIGKEFTACKKRIGAFIPANLFDPVVPSLRRKNSSKK